ncbi:MAG: translation elongation factor 4 [Patescibacteria group bacterium]
MRNIRNFVIIAHIDHGKSTLADRFLEATGTVEMRKMRPQYLDRLDLERERGITIKMAPVRMVWHPRQIAKSKEQNDKPLALGHLPDSEYILNLIDTPGHSDFSYEVSRALQAVEGAILLVDAVKGIQAQTLSNLRAARKAGLTIIGAVNKIDLFQNEQGDKLHPQVQGHVRALAELLEVSKEEIFLVSGKTGEGVKELLRAVVQEVPPPLPHNNNDNDKSESHRHGHSSALIFDSLYDDHKGVLAFIRVFRGTFTSGSEVYFLAGKTKCKPKEIGSLIPEFNPLQELGNGEIGYLATGLKEPDLIKIGDTIVSYRTPGAKHQAQAVPLPGYREPAPVVVISFYPDKHTEFDDLKRSFAKLHLNDAALHIEPEANEALGRGLKVGFLGQLHFEITASRLQSEFGLEFITSFPSVAYRVQEGGREYIITQAKDLPANPSAVFQPMIRLEILTPSSYLSHIMNLKNTFELDVHEVETLGESVLLTGTMPLAELLRDFDDQLKSLSAGYASFSYELAGDEKAEVEKMEILVAEEVVPALTRVVAKKDVEREARIAVERLKKFLPAQQFAQALQARVGGRIIARETIAAMRKDVTGYLYGGDRSRKMKLWKKQKRGKEKLKGMAKVSVPVEVFREILKK